MDEHRELEVSQFDIGSDTVGKYVRFHGRISKNTQGGLDRRKLEPKAVTQYADPTNQRCIVKLFEEYLLLKMGCSIDDHYRLNLEMCLDMQVSRLV